MKYKIISIWQIFLFSFLRLLYIYWPNKNTFTWNKVFSHNCINKIYVNFDKYSKDVIQSFEIAEDFKLLSKALSVTIISSKNRDMHWNPCVSSTLEGILFFHHSYQFSKTNKFYNCKKTVRFFKYAENKEKKIVL